MTDTNTIAAKRPRKMARGPKAADTVVSPATKRQTETKPLGKGAMVEQMLTGEGGVTLVQLCEATGWLPHTSRAFLTGLRKKGRVVERSVGEDGKSLYRITALKVAA